MTAVDELVLVWNVDYSLSGAAAYIGARLSGGDPCRLCELTHDGLNEKPEWKTCQVSLGVPVTGVYKNQLSTDLRAACADDFPAVVAKRGAEHTKLLGAKAIEACDGDVQALYERVVAALAAGAV